MLLTVKTRTRRAVAAIVIALLALTGVVVAAEPAAAATGTITGTVRHGGVASPGLIVQRLTWNGSTYVDATNTTTDAAGVFTFSGLAAGTYTFVAYAGPGSTYADTWAGNQAFLFGAQQFAVNGNTVTSDIAQILGGTFTVLVLEGPGKLPSAGAEVNFCHQEPAGSYCTATGTTNGQGFYTTPRIAPASWQLRTSKTPYFSEYYNDWSFTGFGPYDELTVPAGGGVSAIVWLRTDKLPSETYFQDVPFESTYFDATQWLATNGISTGTPVGFERPLYKPLDAVSRQAMAQFLYRLSDSTFVPSGPQHFADVPPSNAFYGAIEWMYATGLSTGTPQPSGLPLFKPADPVSRQAMASFLYRLADESYSPPGTASFADVPTSSANFAAIEWMKSKGISTGTPQPSGLPLYKPLDPVSRQAMALFLYRYGGEGGDGTS